MTIDLDLRVVFSIVNDGIDGCATPKLRIRLLVRTCS